MSDTVCSCKIGRNVQKYGVSLDRELRQRHENGESLRALARVHNERLLEEALADVTAAVFGEDDDLSYVAYNADPWTKTVSFSDGYSMEVPSNSMKTSSGDVIEGKRTGGGDIGPVEPSAPTDLRSPDKTATSIDLAWVDDGAGVERYYVYFDGDGPVETTTSSSVTVTGPDPGTEYSVTVTAQGTDEESAKSEPITVKTTAVEDVPEHVEEIAKLSGGSDPDAVELRDLQRAIGRWSNNEPLPGESEPVTLMELQDAISYWSQNTGV